MDTRAVIILIPIRLGGEKINPDYFNFVKVRTRLLPSYVDTMLTVHR